MVFKEPIYVKLVLHQRQTALYKSLIKLVMDQLIRVFSYKYSRAAGDGNSLFKIICIS